MSGFIPDDIINRVRDSIDVVELVSRYLSLNKTGANFKALCPFHKEKTPSFTVSPSRQSFHCFGCGKGGNVFMFVMEMERVSFPEAVRSLAKQAGIDIPEARRPTEPEFEEDERATLYEANRRAADFFARNLASPAGEKARQYVTSRTISDDMVQRCQLGYSPDSWDALLRAARPAGIVAETLLKAGLAIKRDDGSGYYDRFRDRLMFPIFDTQDRVIGFGARALADDDDVKYINTPETPLFSKGRNLYGLNWARKAIVDTRRAAVVEGYTDVIMAHQHGIQNVVATLGTALTREHIHLLRRFAQRVDVVFDSDPAGQKAAERSMDLFLNEGAGEFVAAGFDVRIAAIEGGKDPCDVIAEHGPEPFIRSVDAATDIFTQKIRIASARHDDATVEGKTAIVDEVLALAAQVPNAVGRELRMDAVIQMLSNTFDIRDPVLRARLDQIERQKRTSRPREEPPKDATSYDPAERGVIEGLIGSPESAAELLDGLTPDDFEDERLRGLFHRIQELHRSDGIVNPARLLGALTDPEHGSIVSETLTRDVRPGLASVALDCRRALLRRRKQRLIRQIQKQLEKAKASGDEPLADDLNSQYLKLQREVYTP